ncbi:MAG: hypothetical protein MR510_04235 [Clostridium sp.]|uniref:hypothetical protein n=1 Tax=Clostridium sp. TaxID=1506 RepID=UPI002A832C39|nr:hypothetical protein [Clostridium sp.]MCI6691688.1 hypothetical protein [Clostridium sp.]MDY4253669.1 hypothetical protein [Clostridium sp.]
MNKIVKKILIEKENLYSEKIRNEIKDLDVCCINEDDLNEAFNSEYLEKTNFLYCLQYKLLIETDNEKLSYINYLISYYLFIVLTPPFSEELSENYAKQAISLTNKNKKEYTKWLDYIKNGN